MDQGQGDERVRVVPIGPGLWRFATKTYRTWPSKYLPREFCRLLVELVEVREEAAGVRREVVLRVRALAESAK